MPLCRARGQNGAENGELNEALVAGGKRVEWDEEGEGKGIWMRGPGIN